MSAFTTLRVSRSKAKELILRKIFDGMSDEELEHQVDAILEDRLYNCRIVGDGERNDHGEL